MATIGDILLRLALENEGQFQAQVIGAGSKAGTNLGGAMGKSFGTSLKSIASGLLPGLGLGAGVVAFQSAGQAVSAFTGFLSDSIKKAEEEQAGMVLLTASIKQNDQAWDGNTASIEAVLREREKLGFSDGEQRDSLRVLVAQTHDLSDALDAQRVAMDLARLRGIDLSQASLLVGKAFGGNVTALKRFGIEIAAGTRGVAALNAIEKVASGQAEAFSHTQAGAAAALAAEWENFQEDIGNLVLPALTALTQFMVHDVVPVFREGASVVKALADVLGPVLSPILDRLPQVLGVLAVVFGTRLTLGIVNATKAMLGLGVATEEHIATANAAAAATETETAATAAHTVSVDTTTAAIQAEVIATQGEIVAEDAAALATDAHSTAEGVLTVSTKTRTAATQTATVATDAGTAANKGFALSLRSIGIAALIAIPLVSNLIDALGNLGDNLAYGQANADKFRKSMAAAGLTGQSASVALGLLNQIAGQQKRSLSDVVAEFDQYVSAGEDVSQAINDVRDGTKRAAREFEDADRATAAFAATLVDSAAKAQGSGDAYKELFDAIQAGSSDTADQADKDAAKIAQSLIDASNTAGVTISQQGAFWSARLKTGETIFAGSAEELAGKLPGAIKTASDQAAAIAAQTPGKIAAALLGAEDELDSAAGQLAKAANEKLQVKVDIATTRKGIADLLAEIKKGGKGATAEQQIQLTTLETQLAGYLLKQDPKSKEAAGLLEKYLKSADPATRLAAQQILDDAQTEWESKQPEIQKLMEQYGMSLPDAITKHLADAQRAAHDQAEAATSQWSGLKEDALMTGEDAGRAFPAGVASPANKTAANKAGQDLANQVKAGTTITNPYAGGYSIGSSWVKGIVDGARYVYLHELLALSGKIKNLLGGSLPTEGPLQHPDRGGLSIGHAWISGIGKAIASFELPNPLEQAGGALAGAIARPPAIGGIASTAPVLAQSGNTFQLFMQGNPADVTEKGIVAEFNRLQPVALIGG